MIRLLLHLTQKYDIIVTSMWIVYLQNDVLK